MLFTVKFRDHYIPLFMTHLDQGLLQASPGLEISSSELEDFQGFYEHQCHLSCRRVGPL